MHTAYESWHAAPWRLESVACNAIDWVEFPNAAVVRHTDLTVLYRIAGRLVLVAPIHVGLVSTARYAGEVGTLVLPRWLAEELALTGAHAVRAAR